MLKEGTTAPAFKTTDQNGEAVSLKDLRGQKVVLYFYPKDDTPGCTKEACSFRDAYSKFKKQDITVLGVSPDKEASHKKFATKYQLPFTLLADTALDRGRVWCLGREEVHGTNVHGRASDHVPDR